MMIQVSPGRTADTEAEMADDRGFTGYYHYLSTSSIFLIFLLFFFQAGGSLFF